VQRAAIEQRIFLSQAAQDVVQRQQRSLAQFPTAAALPC
jgi:hypothetical protein